MNGTWRRSCRVLLGGAALAALLASPGCVKSSIEVKIRKDGSGRIVVTQVYPREMVNQMAMQRQAAALGGNRLSANVSTNRDPFFDLRALKRNAAQFGSGVTFVKARKIDIEGARGYVALYSFKDVNEVFLNLEGISRNAQTSLNQYQGFGDADDEEDADAEDMAAGRDRGEGWYEFKLTLGPTNRLQVMCPTGTDDGGRSFRFSGMDMDDDMDGGQPKTEEEEDEEAERGAV